MIYADSRYASGNVYRAQNPKTGQFVISVDRVFEESSAEFFTYVWVERDRPDLIASKFLNDPNKWWLIMDYNPEIIDGMSIPVGTSIRIPNVR
jgi:hypothetical protein